MANVNLTFPEGRPTVRADVLVKTGLIAICRSLGKRPGYALIYLPNHTCIMSTRLKRDAVAIRRELEAMDWENNRESVRKRVDEFIREELWPTKSAQNGQDTRSSSTD